MKRVFQTKFLLVVVLVAAAGLAVLAAVLFMPSSKQADDKRFAVDTTLPNGDVELCSGYANLCFTRPADWTRSTILHAGAATENNIEINPPTGRLLRFEAIGDDTNRTCPSNAECHIVVVDMTATQEGDMNVVSGYFETSFTYTDKVGRVAFIQLIEPKDVQALGLEVGKRTPYTSFNRGVAFGQGSKVMLQVLHDKVLDAEASRQWLTSVEGVVAKQILSSVRRQT